MTTAPPSGWLARLVLVRRGAGRRLQPRLTTPLMHTSPAVRSPLQHQIRGTARQRASAVIAGSVAPTALTTTAHAFTTTTRMDLAAAPAAAAAAAGEGEEEEEAVVTSSRSSSRRRGLRKRAGAGTASKARAPVPVAEPPHRSPEVVPPPVAAQTTPAPSRAAAATPKITIAAAEVEDGDVEGTEDAESEVPAAVAAVAAATTTTPTPPKAATKKKKKKNVMAKKQGVMTATNLLTALREKQRLKQQRTSTEDVANLSAATEMKPAAEAADVVEDPDEEGEGEVHIAKAQPTVAARTTHAVTKEAVATPTPSTPVTKVAVTATPSRPSAALDMAEDDSEEVAAAGAPAAAEAATEDVKPLPNRSTSRNNRATKRRAGQSKARGRKRNKRQGDDDDKLTAAAAVAVEEEAAHDSLEERDTLDAAVDDGDASTAHAAVEHDTAADISVALADDEDGAAAEAQAAIDAAVEAAMAADMEDTTLDDIAAHDEAVKDAAPTPSTSAAVAPQLDPKIDVLTPVATATAAVPPPSPSTEETAASTSVSKKKKKKKGKKGAKRQGHAVEAASVTASPVTSAALEADEDAAVAAATLGTEAEAAEDVEASAPVAEEKELAAAPDASEETAAAADALEDMELVFADSWLPPRGQRACDREAAAAEEDDVHEDVVETQAAGAEEVEAEAEAEAEVIPKRSGRKKIKGKRGAKARAATTSEEESDMAASPAAAAAVSATVAAENEMTPDDADEIPPSAMVKENNHTRVAAAESTDVDATSACAAATTLTAPSDAFLSPSMRRKVRKQRLRRVLVQQLKKILSEEKRAARAASARSSSKVARTASTSAAAREVEDHETADVTEPEGAAPAAPLQHAAKQKKKTKKGKKSSKNDSAAIDALAANAHAEDDGDGTVYNGAEKTAETPDVAAMGSDVAADTSASAEEGAKASTFVAEEDEADIEETRALEAEYHRIAAELLHSDGSGEAAATEEAEESHDPSHAPKVPTTATNAKHGRRSIRDLILKASGDRPATSTDTDGALSAKKSSTTSSSAGSSGTGAGKSGGSSSSSNNGKGGGSATSGGGGAGKANANPLFYPDYREQVLLIFQQLAEINAALGERYKTASYTAATEKLKRNDTIFKILPPHLQPVEEKVLAAAGKKEEVLTFVQKRKYVQDASRPIPGVGDKLRKKIVEILQTGDLKELHTLKQKPLIRAIQELTQVHGFGPRTAVSFYKDYGISSVEELKAYAIEHGEDVTLSSSPAGAAASTPPTTAAAASKQSKKKGFHLTDGQRLGLKYYEEIQQRIPHAEGRLHEAYLKLKVRKHLGKHYDITVCGSYRRKCETSGDIDVLVTPKAGAHRASDTEDPLAISKNALATFVAALKEERYIEAGLAQGPTKFMGICRLRSLSAPATTGGKKASRKFCARRIDIRFVDAASFPAALLYFTGSKNFNVVMRAEAIKKNFILNEYGLFKNNSKDFAATSRLHEMISKLAKAQFYTSKSAVKSTGRKGKADADDDADSEDLDGDALVTEDAGEATTASGRKKKEMTKQQIAELKEISKKVESLRVKVTNEKDIFDAIGMDYVNPVDRNL